MPAPVWSEIKDVFEQTLALPEFERAAFLQQHCQGRDALRVEVEALLRADAQAQASSAEQLAQAAPALLEALADRSQQTEESELRGHSVGAWTLLHELGRGGMGRVYLAERADGAYQQKVAIKLLRDPWPTAVMEARLLAERQVLAGLEHPGIARLLDGGHSAEGWPFLVLEYVDGAPIHFWCQQQRLSVPARLKLFLQVCAAVAHAHRCLVVHRDLKPSNILVTSDGQVKLLDFGIAKLLQGPGSGTTLTMRAFTPEYAAPEQVRGDPVTTGVDVHALGLLLYELLTGRRAFGQSDSTPAAYEQAILHQLPVAPSRALAAQPELAARHASDCGLSSSSLSSRLQGDLDAIVLMALRKEPLQRYASVDALEVDIQRHLAHQPVAARRGRWRYRAGRFLRRHAWSSALALLAVLGTTVGLALALWQTGIARAERDRAQTSAATAEQVTAFLTHMLSQATPDAGQGQTLTVRQVLDRAALDLNERLAAQPAVRARVQLMLAQVFDIVATSAEAEPMARGAIQTLTELHGGRSLSVSEALQILATIQRHANQLDAGHASIVLAHSIAMEQLGPDAEITLNLLSDIGEIAYARSDFAAASVAFETALVGVRKLPGANVRRIANILGNHAAALSRAERFAEAEAAHRESLAIRRSLFADPHTNIAFGLQQLGVSLAAQKRFDEARALMDEARRQYVELIGPDAQNTLWVELWLARLELMRGDNRAAIALLTPLLERHRSIYGADALETLGCAVDLAEVLQKDHQPEAAHALLGPAIALIEQQYPDGDILLATALNVQLALDLAAGKPACEQSQRIARMLQRSYADTHSRVVQAQAAVAANCK